MTAVAAARSLFVAIVGFAIGLLLAALALPIAARAQSTDIPMPTPEKPTVNILVYGDDPCPQAKGDEIVVCSRQPESERYRIPKRLRKKPDSIAGNNAWANQVRANEDASRTAAGIPDSCSAVGTAGQSGCYAQFLRQQSTIRQQQQADKQDEQDQSGTP